MNSSKKQKKFIRDKKEKQRRIFQAFTQLVKEHGYEKVSVNHIADAANLSVGTIYRYFPKGKSSIAFGFFEYTKDQIFNLNDIKKIGEEDWNEIFKLSVRNHIKAHRDNYEIQRAYEQAILANPESFKSLKPKVKEMFGDVIDTFKQEGYLKFLAKEPLLKNTLLFFNLTEALVHRHLYIMPIFDTDEELVEFIAKIMVYYVES